MLLQCLIGMKTTCRHSSLPGAGERASTLSREGFYCFVLLKKKTLKIWRSVCVRWQECCRDSCTGVRCVVPISSKFQQQKEEEEEEGGHRDDSHSRGSNLWNKKRKKEGKVGTIVRRLFHQSASVITCQKKRKESPPNDPERLQRRALTSDPSRLVL